MDCATSIASVKHAGGRCVNYLPKNALLVPLHFGRRAMVQQILDIGVGLGVSLEQGAHAPLTSTPNVSLLDIGTCYYTRPLYI